MSNGPESNHIRTVTGDVPAECLHDVNSHDHLFLDLGFSVPNRAEFLLDSEEEAIDELRCYKSVGGGAVVCATPIGLGRRPLSLLRAAQQADVAVVATGGFHKLAYYPANHWVQQYPLSRIAELLYDEATLGIDLYDYSGPYVERTEVRPGVLKAGADFQRFRGREADLHSIVAETALATGLSVMLHVEHGANPHLALDVIEKTDLDFSRIMVCHLDRNPDAELHASVAKRGAYLVYDGLFRERYRPVSAVLDVLDALLRSGQGSQILLGGDLASRSLRRADGAPGLAGLRTELVSRIRTRFGDEVVDDLVTNNPRRAFVLKAVAT